MDWYKNHDKLLLVEVRKNEVIYDRNHKSYRDLDERDRAWINIGIAMKKNAEECKKRWKLLRDKYVRERKKSNFADNVTSDWSLWPLICFIEPHLRKKKRYERSDSDAIEENFPSLEQEEKSGNVEDGSNLKVIRTESIRPRLKPSTKKKRLNEELTTASEVNSLFKEEKKASSPLESFLDYVYSEVKSWPDDRVQIFIKSSFNLVQELKNSG